MELLRTKTFELVGVAIRKPVRQWRCYSKIGLCLSSPQAKSTAARFKYLPARWIIRDTAVVLLSFFRLPSKVSAAT